MRIGVDIGGTFTDVVLLDAGRLSVHKVPSTPADPGEAVLAAADELGVDLRTVELFAHGTTITTNAVIQRAGARTGLLTTQGFRDVLQIRRTTRGKLYDFQWDPPDELVPRTRRREVAERTAAGGTVTRAPDLEAAAAEIAALVEDGVEALAICFLNAYVNPENEERVRAVAAEVAPELPVYLSSQLLPEWREFERTSTTVVNAYVGPVLSRYVERLEHDLVERGYRSELMVMSSNGGLATGASSVAAPARTLVSGPAAGVIAQVALLEAAGIEDAIGIDIGGTSTDVSVIQEGAPRRRSEFELEFGTVVSYPAIDINAIGAGGGTVAWVDPGGMLRLGPRSAGASPGPACFQRGGTKPTLTDANVVLHRLNPRELLGGRLPVSEEAARQAVGAIGRALGLGEDEMAQGIVDLAVAHVAQAIRELTVERGLDPRRFALVGYGGAGPLHAAAVASDLGVGTVVVPRFPGVTSALGLLYADIRHDFVRTHLARVEETTPEELAGVVSELVELGRTRLAAEGLPSGRMAFVATADLRYVGQTHELNVVLPSDPGAAHGELDRLLAAAHRHEFGHAPAYGSPVELVSVRLAAVGALEPPELPEAGRLPEPRPVGMRDVFFGGSRVEVPTYERDALGAGAELEGPALVEQLDSTTLVPAGWRITVDRLGNLLLEGGPT